MIYLWILHLLTIIFSITYTCFISPTENLKTHVLINPTKETLIRVYLVCRISKNVRIEQTKE